MSVVVCAAMGFFTELLCGTTPPSDASTLSVASWTRLGRAFGTLTRRRMAAGRALVVVARAPSSGEGTGTALVRDGIVRGLLLSGHDVKDIGAVPTDVFTFALMHLDAGAGVFIGDVSSMVFLVGGRSLVGDGLQALGDLADGDAFCAGQGSLDLVDVRGAYRAQSARGERA